MQPKYLNIVYLYFPLNTHIYLNKRLFSLLNCLRGKISISHKLGFPEITPPQSLLPSNVQILNLMLTYVLSFFILLVIHCVWQNKNNKNNKPSNLWYVAIVFSCVGDHHCVVPENIHASPAEGISSKTSPPIRKFQLSFRHFFEFFGLQSLLWAEYGYFQERTFLQCLNNWLKHVFLSHASPTHRIIKEEA